MGIEKIVNNMWYIRIAEVLGLSVVLLGFMYNNLFWILIGTATVGIQVMKDIQMYKKNKEVEVVGERAKGQWEVKE